jgi:D-alanyl-lipoteichoic acid acyltransferase DltB (MBOAT superfamily)
MHQLARSKKRKEGGKGVFLSCLVKMELLLYVLSITLTKKKDLYTSSTKDLSAFLFSFFFQA